MKSGIENLKQTAVRQATTDVYVVRCRIEQGFRESRLAQSQSRLLFTQLQTLRSPALNAAMGHQQTCWLILFHVDLPLNNDWEGERKRRALADL